MRIKYKNRIIDVKDVRLEQEYRFYQLYFYEEVGQTSNHHCGIFRNSNLELVDYEEILENLLKNDYIDLDKY